MLATKYTIHACLCGLPGNSFENPLGNPLYCNHYHNCACGDGIILLSWLVTKKLW